MGWSQRKRCWVVGVCRGAAAGQGWPMPRFVWILGGCWVGAKTTTGLTDTAWMGPLAVEKDCRKVDVG